ncbi:MAG: flagellar protein FliT [Lachnospiraceae bacterium]|jgi:hypothetical protein|nr:flagellar protein FliT [Lachnospiraceae bacterium]
MTKQYIGILIDSLQKKDKVLSQIIQINRKQTDIIKTEPLDEDAFDREAEEKDGLISELDELDEGFDRVFHYVEKELSTDEGRKPYATEILQMKALISAITEKSVTIQAGEARNKKALEDFFKTERDRIKTGRVGSKTALNYYNNMKNRNHVPPHFLDSKN